jgi:hypothetical protein
MQHPAPMRVDSTNIPSAFANTSPCHSSLTRLSLPHPGAVFWPLMAAAAVVDLNQSNRVEREEFRDLIMHMAAADVHGRRSAAGDGEWLMCSYEEDEEIQTRLKSWVDNLMLRRYR